MPLFYKPTDGVAADFIPFYWQGRFHLFYLKDYRDIPAHGEGTPWFQLVTVDFVHFEEWGESLPRGPVGSQDQWVFTGSVFEKDGTFHIFYTGHNHHLAKENKPVQAVLHATSYDLKTWVKDEGFALFAPADGYEINDWRDPFIYRDARYNEYGMLLAARTTGGASRHRGCVALATSLDLMSWKVQDPFWAPQLYFTHECPDLFKIGDWWYLIYSTFTERSVTHYRMARTLDGPWLCPPDDQFDSRAFYAAKTASDGDRRFIFGWLPTRDGEKDEGSYQWGGNLVTHEVKQQPDGTLSVRSPDTVLDHFLTPVSLSPEIRMGRWMSSSGTFHVGATGRFASLLLGAMPETCLINAKVLMKPGTVSAGLILRSDDAYDNYYQLRIEPASRRIVFDRWPRPGDQPHMHERPLEVSWVDPIHLRVIVDGTCMVAYINDRVALSSRIYNHRAGQAGLFAVEGDVTFTDVTVWSH